MKITQNFDHFVTFFVHQHISFSLLRDLYLSLYYHLPQYWKVVKCKILSTQKRSQKSQHTVQLKMKRFFVI